MFNKNKIIVIGQGGYIAGALLKSSLIANKDILVTSSRNEIKNSLHLDLNSPDIFNYDLINKDDIILMLASVSSPDACEKKYDYAYGINVEGTKRFIEKALNRNARVLFFSSDTIYGNSEGIKDENSEPDPFGKYAEMKCQMESFFANRNNFKVFRLSYVFSRKDKFSLYLEHCYKNRLKAEIIHPFFRNVVCLHDVISAIAALVNNWSSLNEKVFNICGDELLSKYDIVELLKKYIFKEIKYDLITPPEEFFLARPKVINIKSLFIGKLLGRRPLSIEYAVQSGKYY